MTRWWMVAVLSLVQAGCFNLMRRGTSRPVKLVSKALGTAGPPIAVDKLQVMRFDQLPAGILQANQANGTVKVWAVPDWPTAEDHHRVVAAYAWTGGGYGTLPEEVKAAAAKTGANTLVKLPSRAQAYALYLSSATPAFTPQPAAELLAAEAARHTDFKPLGDVQTVPGSPFAPFVVQLKKDHCYRVVVALEKGTRWGPAARQFLSVGSRSADALAGNRSGGVAEVFTTDDGIELKAPYHGKLVRMRSFSMGLGCAAGSGQAQLVVTGKGRSVQVADGQLKVQVLAKRITPAETALLIEKRKAAFAKAAAESAAFAAREQQRAAQAAARQARLDAQRARQPKRAAPRAPSGPRPVSVTIHSRCKRTVRIFQGKKPKWGSGRYGRHSANSISSYSGREGDMIWIVDDRNNGLGATTLTAGVRNLVILPSCTGFAPR